MEIIFSWIDHLSLLEVAHRFFALYHNLWSLISSFELTINTVSENAAKVIQSHFRRSVERHNFLKMRRAASFLQTAIRAWLMVKKRPFLLKFSSVTVQDFRCGTYFYSPVHLYESLQILFSYSHTFLFGFMQKGGARLKI
jgi:hypothetical protein